MSGIGRLTSIYLQNAKGTPCVSRFGSETIAYAQRLATVSHRFGEFPLSRAGPPGIPKWLRSGSTRDPKGDPKWTQNGPELTENCLNIAKIAPKSSFLVDQILDQILDQIFARVPLIYKLLDRSLKIEFYIFPTPDCPRLFCYP